MVNKKNQIPYLKLRLLSALFILDDVTKLLTFLVEGTAQLLKLRL